MGALLIHLLLAELDLLLGLRLGLLRLGLGPTLEAGVRWGVDIGWVVLHRSRATIQS